MGEGSYEIAREITETRHELGENLQELEHKFKGVTDWRRHVDKHPFTVMILAFGGGVLLSQFGRGNSRSRRNPRDNSEDREHSGSKIRMKKAADAWDNMRAALVGVAASRVQQFLREAIPGFHEEYAKVEQRRFPAPSQVAPS
jgi:hypothetical protein